MQWSQIKTLFILCFLILNAYLLYELYEKQKRPDGVIEPSIVSTIEEQLQQDNITIPDLPADSGSEKEPFITVEQKSFTKEELSALNKLKEQATTVIDDKLITSILDTSVSIPNNASTEAITELVQEIVPFLNEYTFWKWNTDLNIMIFFQQKNGRPIYYNQSGLVLLFLNDNNEITFYSQSMLGEEEARQETRTLISPIESIEKLYNSGELFYGDEVNKVEVGFHTRIPSTNGVQVFVPTWKVTINETKNYFVNAIEGYIFSSNDQEFLEVALTKDLERIKSFLNDKSKFKERIIEQYNQKLEMIKQGGE